jgi:hypothetical protein
VLTTSGLSIIYLSTYNPDIMINQIVSGLNIPVGAVVVSITSSNINGLTNLVGGSGYVDGNYPGVLLSGGSGFGATANIAVTGGIVTGVTLVNRGSNFLIGDSLTTSNTNLGGTGAGFSIDVATLYQMGVGLSVNATGTDSVTATFSTHPDLIKVYQHEVGVDAVDGQNVLAIQSLIETNDLGWVSGGPSEPSMEGLNRWLRLERVEPDFLLSGTMKLYITGRPYAQSEDETSAPYVFDANTNKIDMKEQRRELRLIFESDEAGGNYQMGRVILNADIGDVRGY